MPLENTLSASPYFDDYDQAKEFYKVLFKPGVALQTRELNQLQSILQNQIERFGNHVFKSGTIISGVNFSYIPTYTYVKILDTETSGTPSLPSSYVDYFVKSDLNLTARIVNYEDGLESKSPDLKTLYLQYTNSSQPDTANGNAIYTTFRPDQLLTVYSKDNNLFSVTVNNGGLGFSNADAVVVTSAITITGNTIAFANGETITQSTTGAKAVIASVNTTAIANTTILKIKPRTADLTNTSVSANAWTMSTGYNVVGGTSGATANVVSLIGSGAVGLVSTDTQGIVQTLTLADGGAGYDFLPHVTLKTANSTATVNNLDLQPSNFKALITVANTSTNAIGTGYAFGVSEGIIYQKGYFLKVEPQVITVDKFTTAPDSVAVGFKTVETIVDAYTDESLYDNAANTTNYTAPGADRLTLTPVLTLMTTAEAQANVDFFALAEWKEGFPYKENRVSVYSNLADELARRTREAQGNFVVDSFQVGTKEKATPNTSTVQTVIDPGLAYISGYRVQTSYNNYLDVDRSTTKTSLSNQSITVNYGNYVKVKELAGLFNFKAGDTVSLYDTAKQYVSASTISTNGSIAPAGTQIGTARIRSLVIDSGSPGTPDCVYRMYLFDVVMTPGHSFRQARSIFFDGTVQDGIADIALEYDATTSANLAFLNDVNNDQLIFNIGQPAVATLSDLSYQYRTVSDATLQLTSGGQVVIGPLGSGLSFPYSDGTLSSTQERDFIVFPIANTQAAANIGGSLAVNASNTIIVGTSTTFASDLRVGDHVKLLAANGSSIVRQVSSIANNTYLTLTSNASVSFTANAVIFYPALYPLDIENRSDRTITVSASSKTVTININKTLAGTANVIAVYNIKSTAATPVTKTIKRDIFVKLHTSNNVSSNTGPWALGLPGAARLKKVFLGTDAAVNTSSTDVTKYFYVDSGDDENAYRTSRLVLNTGANLAVNTNQYIMAQLDVFTNNGQEGFFTVGSYNIDDTKTLAASNTTINTLEIPETITNKGIYYDQRDVIDFRPYGTATANLSTTVAGATVNPANTFALSGDDQFFPVPDSAVTFGVEYYNTRMDRVVVRQDSTFEVLSGVSTLSQPVPPRAPADAVTLALLTIPPYPSLPSAFNSTTLEFVSKGVGSSKGPISKRTADYKINTRASKGTRNEQPRRYTMQDLGAIERRLTNVEYAVSLSQVESAIKDVVIPSGITPTTSRFKNGFFVEPFDDYTKVDLSSREYAATIDQQKGFLKPPTKQINFEACFDLTDTATANSVVTGNTLMLPFTDELLIDQSIKSSVVGVDGHRIQFNGEGTITPSSFSIQTRGEVTVVEDPPPLPPPNYGGPGDDSGFFEGLVEGVGDLVDGILSPISDGDCFTPETIIFMADGSSKQIKDVKAGERVLASDMKTVNTVRYIEMLRKTSWDSLYSPSPSFKPFVTVNHPLIINGELVSVDPNETYMRYPWLGMSVSIDKYTDHVEMIPSDNRPVYNLWVDGDGTYIVNGFGTTSIVGHGYALAGAVLRGSINHDQTMEIMRRFTSDGRELQYGSYIVNKVLDKLNIKWVNDMLFAVALQDGVAKKALFGITRFIGTLAWMAK
jgi:hypothetical protein